MSVTQRELHQRLHTEHLAIRQRIADLVRPIDAARLAQRTEPNGWSAAEVLEHLVISDELYATRIASLVKTARPDAGAPAREWKPTVLGKFLANVLAKPGKVKAPKKFQPGPAPRNGVAETFLARELVAAQTMDDAASLDWRALRIGSPALPSWAPTMNLGDIFNIKVVHLTRHAKQIERVLSKL
jgi:hypothetical protein